MGMPAATDSPTTEVELATCDCCGLKEECTPAYINSIRQRFHGNWICGLCGEAVKDEIARRKMTTEDAMASHMSFCRAYSNESPEVHYISAVKMILRRHLGSPAVVIRSVPNSPLKSMNSVRLSRSESCLTDLTLELQEMIDDKLREFIRVRRRSRMATSLHKKTKSRKTATLNLSHKSIRSHGRDSSLAIYDRRNSWVDNK